MSIIKELKEEIASIQARVKGIQDLCSHPEQARVKVNRGSSGNYDPSNDRYWTEHECKLCEKTWSTEQGK